MYPTQLKQQNKLYIFYAHLFPLCSPVLCFDLLYMQVSDEQKLSFCIPISHFKLSISLTNFFFVTLFFIHFQKTGRLGSVLKNKV